VWKAPQGVGVTHLSPVIFAGQEPCSDSCDTGDGCPCLRLRRRSYEGATAMHNSQTSLLYKRGDRSTHSRPTHAVDVIGERLLRGQSSTGRQFSAVEIGQQVVPHLLPHQRWTVVVDPVSAVTPRHADTVDTP
jgi:hypothetical protein